MYPISLFGALSAVLAALPLLVYAGFTCALFKIEALNVLGNHIEFILLYAFKRICDKCNRIVL